MSMIFILKDTLDCRIEHTNDVVEYITGFSNVYYCDGSLVFLFKKCEKILRPMNIIRYYSVWNSEDGR